MKTAVITGPTGAIGRALIEECIRQRYEVLTIVHRSSDRAADLERMPHVQVLRLNLEEYHGGMEELEKRGICVEGCELFFHLAWEAPFGSGRDDLKLQLRNVEYALDAVQLAKELGCTTFLGTGSQAEYGRKNVALRPDTPANPETGYGIAKLCAGQMTRIACELADLKHIWCRVLSVYGPCDRAETLIGTALRRMKAGEETEFTPCEQIWDYLYSADATRALFLAAQYGQSGQTYVVGSGQAHPLREYIETIARITGYEQKIGFGRRPYPAKQVMHLQADITELQKLGFTPRIGFEEGIRICLEKL